MAVSRRARWYALAGALAGLIVLARPLAALWVDILWFGELGYGQVWWRRYGWQLLVGGTGGLVVGAVLFVNLLATRRVLLTLPFGVLPPAYARYLRPRVLGHWALAASAIFGALVGIGLAAQWETVMLYVYRVPWGQNDPLFGRDVAHYVFAVPFYRLLQRLVTLTVSLALLASAAVYVAFGALRPVGGSLELEPRVKTHLALLVSALLLLKSADYRLAAWGLLQSTRGVTFGAGYTDARVLLPGLMLLAVAALVAAFLAAYAAYRRRLRPLLIALGGMVGLSLLVGSIAPALVQRLVVEPNEQAVEAPYIAHNITFTRYAYGLDRVTVREFAASPDIDAATLSEHRATLDNIRLWDVRPLLSTYRQRQNIRQYYNFHDVDVDRYRLDGQLRQVLLAPRELDVGQLDPDAATWVNVHLRYTHGYGVVVSPAAAVAAGGQPEFWVRDIPPRSSIPLTITRPEIYFGEVTHQYIIVNGKEPEIDYPTENEAVAETFYQGRAGIAVGSPLRRLLFAVHLGDANLLFSGALTGESRILLHRQVEERVRRIAPFLLYDRDPYVVIDDEGRLVWLLDAYTATGHFPYAQPYRGDYAPRAFRGYNYVRNAVKVVVDAYHGDVNFYVFDEGDPLIRAYARAFPGLFRPAEEMPPDLRQHARYPEDLFRLQAEMYTLYHMVDPRVFYNQEDVWALPQELFEQEPVVMEPYYLVMRLEQGSEPEFLLMLPFTPANRANMIAWMAGRSDGDRLGELFVFNLPKDRQIFGPMQVENRINQHDEIAQNLALWNQQGTSVIRGSLLVVPVGETLLYVEPLYLRSAAGGLPELRRVIVGVGDRQPVMAESFAAALARALGDGTQADGTEAPGRPPSSPMPQEAWAREALRLYRAALEALTRGDFATFGEHLRALGELLERQAGEDRERPEG